MFPVGTGMNRIGDVLVSGCDSVPRGYGDEPATIGNVYPPLKCSPWVRG